MTINNVGKIHLDRVEPCLVAPDMDALIDLWIDDCADRLNDLGPNGFTGTTAGYVEKIAYFREWWSAVGPGLNHRLTRRSLRDFERWLRVRPSRYNRQLAYNTRRDALRRLRQMLRWAMLEGYINGIAPADWVPPAVGEPPQRVAASEDALGALLDAAASTSQPVRNLAILATLIGTGIRRAECAGLDVDDVRFDLSGAGVLMIRHAKRTKRGLIVRDAAFDEVTGAYLIRWLNGAELTAGPLFPARHGGRLSPQGLYKAVRQCWLLAGLETDQPVHDLRRAFITDWRRRHRGEDMDELLQMQVGHVDGEMTSQYSLQASEDVQAVHTSPMQRIRTAVPNWPGQATA